MFSIGQKIMHKFQVSFQILNQTKELQLHYGTVDVTL